MRRDSLDFGHTLVLERSGGCPEFRGTSVVAQSVSGCAHFVIVHDGSDIGSLAFEGYSECR